MATKRMRVLTGLKGLAGVLLGGLLLLSAELQAQTADEQEARQREELLGPRPDTSSLSVLRFVTEGDYPPFNYFDEDGQLIGFNVDIARAVCRELEINCEINAIPWESLIPSLLNREADAAIASIAITPESVEKVSFTNRYYETPARFVARSGHDIAGVTPNDLESRSVGVLAGTAHEAFLRDFYEDVEIKTFKSADEMRAALKSGAVDLIFGDVVSLMFWVNGQQSEGCCVLLPGGFNEPRYFGEGGSIAVARGNLSLIEILNYGLARVRISGRYDEIFLRYFPANFY